MLVKYFLIFLDSLPVVIKDFIIVSVAVLTQARVTSGVTPEDCRRYAWITILTRERKAIIVKPFFGWFTQSELSLVASAVKSDGSRPTIAASDTMSKSV